MILPTLHLNGTSYDELFQQTDAACIALYDAAVALRDAYPNGRDYYVQGDAAFNDAKREHAARINSVTAVLEEMQTLREKLIDQKNAHEVRRR